MYNIPLPLKMSIIVKKTVNDLWITEAAYIFACRALSNVSEREFCFDDCTEAEKDAGEVWGIAFAKWKAARATAAETIAYATLAALFETRSE